MKNNISTTDRNLLQFSAILLFAGVLISFVAGFFHPDHTFANDHPAVFAEYATSSRWKLVHLGQFVGMMFIIAGLLALYFALNIPLGTTGLTLRFGAIAAAIALALYGVLQAVDAWATASQAEKMTRFASAEAIRWLEWAVRSYQNYMLGLSFLLFGIVILLTARVSRWIGFLMSISGLAYFMQGWIIGSEGFAAINKVPTLLGVLSILAWSIGLLIFAFRSNRSSQTESIYVR